MHWPQTEYQEIKTLLIYIPQAGQSETPRPSDHDLWQDKLKNNEKA